MARQGGRAAITGRDHTRVWDFLPLHHARGAKQFTRYPHLTLSIEDEAVFAQVTAPNGIKTELSRRWRAMSRECFAGPLESISDGLQPVLDVAPGAAPWFVGIQRRYPNGPRSVPIVDARFDFDLRTLAPATAGQVKPQPVFLETAYSAAIQNRAPNFQVGIGLKLSYRDCPTTNTPEAITLVKGTWLACRPLVDLLLNSD